MTDRSYESLPATVAGGPVPIDIGDYCRIRGHHSRDQHNAYCRGSDPTPTMRAMQDRITRPSTGLRAPRRIEPRSLVVAGVRPRAYIVHPEDELNAAEARRDRFARVRMARPASPTSAGKAPPRLDRLSVVERAAWAVVAGVFGGLILAALAQELGL